MGTYNLLMAGVGGQGILRATDVLAHVAMAQGLDVKKTEIHGTAQRGGMVYSHVRFGQKVFSPIITPGNADSLIACEALEALRWAAYLRPGGKMILDPARVVPPMVTLGWFAYPGDVVGRLRERGIDAVVVDTRPITRELGDRRLANMVLLGVQSRFLGFSLEAWRREIRSYFPEAVREQNVMAFMMGRRYNIG